MGKSKKSSSKRQDPVAANRPKVIKAGVYDGSTSSRDFIVSGHSTGSPNTEMEALSHQVSLDAGRVPDYPVDDNFRVQKVAGNFGETIPEDRRDSDLGGPVLYGPNPSLLKDSPLSESAAPKKVGLLGSLGLLGAAIAGIAAYKIIKNPELIKRQASPAS